MDRQQGRRGDPFPAPITFLSNTLPKPLPPIHNPQYSTPISPSTIHHPPLHHPQHPISLSTKHNPLILRKCSRFPIHTENSHLSLFPLSLSLLTSLRFPISFRIPDRGLSFLNPLRISFSLAPKSVRRATSTYPTPISPTPGPPSLPPISLSLHQSNKSSNRLPYPYLHNPLISPFSLEAGPSLPKPPAVLFLPVPPFPFFPGNKTVPRYSSITYFFTNRVSFRIHKR